MRIKKEVVSLAKNIRSNKWTFLLYQESAPENYLEILEEMHVPFVLSPWHDKDVNKETGELIKREGSILRKNKEELVGAWCTVYRKDWKYPITKEVNFDEYIQKKKDGTPNTNWENRPDKSSYCAGIT